MLRFNPFSALTSKIFGGIAIAALTFGAVQTIRIEGLKVWPLEIEGYAAANARLTADIAAIKRAQIEAEAKQAAQDQTEFSEKTQLAEQIDDLSEQAHDAARAAVAAYARDHPVRLCRQTSDGAASGSGSAGLPGDPGPPADGNPAADLVAITRADLDTLGDKAVQDTVKSLFLNGLVEAGWAVPRSAVPAPDFGGNAD